MAAQLVAEPAARTVPQQVARQVGLTARAGLQSIAGFAGIFTDPVTALINAVSDEPRAMRVRDLAGQLADVLGLPKAETATERVVGTAAESMAGGGVVASVAAKVAPMLSGAGQAVAGQLAAQPAAQVAGSAGAGAAGQVAAESGAGPAGQIAASLAGGMAGAAVVPRGRTPTPAPTNQLVQEGQAAGVPIMTSDAIPPSGFMGKLGQATGERIPLAGTAGARVQQQAARVEAVKRLADDFGAAVDTRVDDVIAADLVKTRGATLDKYIRLKREAFLGAPATPVAVPRAVRQIDEEIARLQQLGPAAAKPEIVNMLEDFKVSIQGKGIFELDDVRKLLGDQLKAPDLAAARSVTEKIPSRVYGALRTDIGEHVLQGGPREYAKWKTANARLAELAGEAETGRLRAALRQGEDTPETVTALLFSNKPSEVRRLYANLSPEGRANARVAVLSRALKQSQDAAGEISPQKFAQQVRVLGDQVGVFFDRGQAQRIEALARVLRATQRASEAAAAPPTGVQAMPFVGGAFLADLFGTAGAAVGSAAAIGGLARAYESKAVRDLLLQVGKSKPGSEQEMLLSRGVIAALLASQATNQQPEQRAPKP